MGEGLWEGAVLTLSPFTDVHCKLVELLGWTHAMVWHFLRILCMAGWAEEVCAPFPVHGHSGRRCSVWEAGHGSSTEATCHVRHSTCAMHCVTHIQQ